MASTKLTYNRGTTKTFGFTYSNTNLVAGSTVLFTVKEDLDTDITDANVLVKKSITLVANAATIEITPSDIATTWLEGDYIYDFKVIDANSKIYLIVEGVFTLNVSATNRIT